MFFYSVFCGIDATSPRITAGTCGWLFVELGGRESSLFTNEEKIDFVP
jgi:hypothetical protein